MSALVDDGDCGDTPGNEAGDLARFTALLPDGTYGLCHEPAVNDFRGERVPLGDVGTVVDSLPDCSTWLSISQVAPVGGGRGGKADMRRMVALPNDFDVKPMGFPDYPSALAAIGALSRVLGTLPAVIVATGHGLQAWWLLDPDDPDWACDGPDDPRWLDIVATVEGRWARLVRRVCAEHGGAMDNVFDVSRIMRLPGTVNTKDPERPAPSAVLSRNEDYIPLSFTALVDVLDDQGVPELPEDRKVAGELVSAQGEWGWADSACRWSSKAIAGLATDTPGTSGRHPWLLGKAVRLVTLQRYGCLTEDDYTAAVAILRARFLSILADPQYGEPRPQGRREFDDALAHAVRTVEGWTDGQVEAELRTKAGDLHDHDGLDPVSEWSDGEGRSGEEGEATPPPPERRSLAEVHATFAKWFGPRFDMQYLDVLLAAAASGLHTDGDPCWLLVVGGAGVGKTEALSSTERAGCMVVSTISSEAALLSGTSRKEVHKTATGGILRTIGDRGTLIIKDFTSILSMRNDDKNAVLAALREVYDGIWVRTLGVDGGRTLRWEGRMTVIGGVTSAYDQHHGVIAAMGDRFLLLRVDSDDEDVRRHAARQSMMNSGGEEAMRVELGEVVAGFLLNLEAPDLPPPSDLIDELIGIADVITRARSQVASDYKGDPEWAHAPEMPTRVAKQLVQLWRGSRITGRSDEEARRTIRRVAHDTLPPGRRLPLLDVIDHPGSTSAQVAGRIGMSRTSVDRKLQELALHKLVQHTPGGQGQAWQWTPVPGRVSVIDLLRTGVGSTSFDPCPENDRHAGNGDREGGRPSQMGLDERSEGVTPSPTYFSGQPSQAEPNHACAGPHCRTVGCAWPAGSDPNDVLEDLFR